MPIGQPIAVGVKLIEDDVAYNGDMYQVGDTYVFHVAERSIDPGTIRIGDMYAKLLDAYWTRDRVFVVPRDNIWLSEATIARIKENA